MIIKKLTIESSKNIQSGEKALLEYDFKRIGKAVITTNDGHEVTDIYEKDGEMVYILNVDRAGDRIIGVTTYGLENINEYHLVD